MAETLLIAIGNSLRGDDGIAAWVAAKAAAGGAVEVREVHQLSPELAAEMKDAEVVYFLDAEVGLREPSIRRVKRQAGGSLLSHHVTPEAVLDLAATLYGFCGDAYVCGIPAICFDDPDALTGEALAGGRRAVRLLAGRIRPAASLRRSRAHR